MDDDGLDMIECNALNKPTIFPDTSPSTKNGSWALAGLQHILL
jgi:hypothetical protein